MSEANTPPFSGAYLDSLPVAVPYDPELPYQPAMQFEEVAALHGVIVRLMNEKARRDAEGEERLARERAARRQAEEEARYDPKTGLLNFPAFQNRVVQRISHMDRHTDKYPSGTSNFGLLVDIDRFKTGINDPLGHAAGDIVIKYVASQLRDSVREGDDVSRFGGEEYAACLYGVTLDEAIQVAERYRQALRSQTVEEIVEGHLRPGADAGKIISDSYVTVSIGIAELPQVAGNFNDTFTKADGAMYHVKNTTRDGIAYHQNGFTHLVGRDSTEPELLLPE